MSNDGQARCKRCGSTSVGWAKSKRTGRYYLAFATVSRSIALEGGGVAPGGVTVHAHQPHECTNPMRGGRPDEFARRQREQGAGR